MTQQEQIVLDIIEEVLPASIDATQLSWEQDLREYGLDSLRLVQLIVSLEEALGVSFPFDRLEMEHMTTVGDIDKTICQLLEEYT